jgi:hypothetical protein
LLAIHPHRADDARQSAVIARERSDEAIQTGTSRFQAGLVRDALNDIQLLIRIAEMRGDCAAARCAPQVLSLTADRR